MMKRGRKTIAVILVLSLAIAALLQPRTPVQAHVEDFYVPLFKPGIWQTLDNLEKLSNNPEDWIESGNYCYEFLDSQKKYITIRDFWKIDSPGSALTIPGEIDGHKVLGVGTWPTNSEEVPKYQMHKWSRGFERIVMQDKPIIKEIILPEGLEFLGSDSFYDCYNLEKIYLPDSLVVIADKALSCATDLREIEFPQGVYVDSAAFGGEHKGTHTGAGCVSHPLKMVLYSNSYVDLHYGSYISFPRDKNTELDIRYHDNKSYYYELRGYIKKLRVDKRLSSFQLEMEFEDDAHSHLTILDYYVTKLIMNGKNTKLKLSAYVNDLPLLHMDDSWNSGVKGLYTVKGAKAIKEARKYKVPYYWKESGKAKELKARKNKKEYQASWKKIKTIEHRHAYIIEKNKWREKKIPVKTVYNVYGKKKKNDSYQLIKTTKKRSIQSKYKYIKVVPVKEWE